MSNNYECRICYEEEKNKKTLIHPCACDGTNRYVHRTCLNEWRLYGQNPHAKKKCMECRKQYIFTKKYPQENYSIHLFSTGDEMLFQFGLIELFVIIICIIFFTIDSSYNNIAMKDTLHIFNVDDSYDLYYDNDVNLYLFYFTFTTFLLACIFHIISTIMIYRNIHRKKHYFILTAGIHLISVIVSSHYLYFIYIISIFHSELCIFIMGLLSFFNPCLFFLIIENHNEILEILNKKFNKKIIKNLEQIMIV